jgi:fluoroacetyl-CoA thioesterase
MSEPPAVPVGLVGAATLVVGEVDTAVALGSGDVPVLGTPRVVALVEQAACEALDGRLPEGATSVGARVEIDHLRPTRIGGTVTAVATLETAGGRKLDFTVSVREGDVEVARGAHRRVVVDRAAFG